MFDIGGPELLVVALIAIIVIGPRELPGAIRTVTHWIRKARGLAAEFRSGLDDMVRETELDEVKRDIESALDPYEMENSIKGEFEQTIDPDGEVRDAFDMEGDWYGPDEELNDLVEAESPEIFDDDSETDRTAAGNDGSDPAEIEQADTEVPEEDEIPARSPGVRATS